MKKAVFFDIDGTIWDQYMKIPDSTREAIRLLRENGVYTFICSGRALAFLQNPTLHELGFDGVLSACGTCVTYKDKEIVYETIPIPILEKTLEVLKRYDMPMVLEGKYDHYLEEEDFAGDPFLQILQKEIGEHLRSISEYAGKWEVNKFSASIRRKDFREALKELEPWYDFLVHGEIVVEGVPKGFSKASGIQAVCEYLGIDHKDTYAFGDSVNDAEMLKYVAHGIAMGNGTDEAKSVADYVTDDLHRDGIYKACKHFGLI